MNSRGSTASGHRSRPDSKKSTSRVSTARSTAVRPPSNPNIDKPTSARSRRQFSSVSSRRHESAATTKTMVDAKEYERINEKLEHRTADIVARAQAVGNNVQYATMMFSYYHFI